MPIEQDPAKCYQNYLSSQKRVERWVAETGRSLLAGGPADAPTPLSATMPTPPPSAHTPSVAAAAAAEPAPVEQASPTLEDVTQQRPKQVPGDHAPVPVVKQEVAAEGIEVTGKPVVPAAATATSRPRTRTSGRSSSKHHDSDTAHTHTNTHTHAHTHRTHTTAHESGRSRPSSGTKGVKGERTTRHDYEREREHGVSRSRSKRTRKSEPPSLSAYLPYGVLPLLLAVTGTSVLSVVLAGVLLAGYSFNANMAQAEQPKSSSSKTHRHHRHS